MSRDGYIWDEDTNQANVESHGISFERASLVLERGKPVRSEPYERNGEARVRSLARVNGETIAVIHTVENGQTKILSAHKGRGLEAEYATALEARGDRTNQIFDPEFAAWRDLDKEQQGRSRAAFRARQQHDLRQLEEARDDAVMDIAAIKQRQRVEAIAERAPRLERDRIDRVGLAASLKTEPRIAR